MKQVYLTKTHSRAYLFSAGWTFSCKFTELWFFPLLLECKVILYLFYYDLRYIWFGLSYIFKKANKQFNIVCAVKLNLSLNFLSFYTCSLTFFNSAILFCSLLNPSEFLIRDVGAFDQESLPRDSLQEISFGDAAWERRSNVCQVEDVLLTWLTHHYNEQFTKLQGSMEQRTITNFDHDLQDGLVLTAVTMAFCPYLGPIYFHHVFTEPTTTTQVQHRILVSFF